MWLIQWAPGACLVAWPLAAWALTLDETTTVSPAGTGAAIAFILAGMLFGVTLWALIALSSLPLFFAVRRWIDRPVSSVTIWRGVAAALTAVMPLLLVVALYVTFHANGAALRTAGKGQRVVLPHDADAR